MPSMANFAPINTGGVRRMPGNRLDVLGGIAGAVEGSGGGGGLRGAIAGGLRGLAGSGSEPPQGSPAVPGSNLVAGGPSTPCPEGSTRIFGKCFDFTPGGSVAGGGMLLSDGEPVLGRYGVGMVPEQMQRTRLRCPDGMVLGRDNVCYNKRDLAKRERKWVPSRKPLLTGGELNAIQTALSAAKKLDRQKKKLKTTARAFERAS